MFKILKLEEASLCKEFHKSLFYYVHPLSALPESVLQVCKKCIEKPEGRRSNEEQEYADLLLNKKSLWFVVF